MSESTLPPAAAHVGDDVQRVDDAAKLTGGAMYASDLVFAGMLYAQVKKSPHARRRSWRSTPPKPRTSRVSTRSLLARSLTTASACTL